MLDYMMPEMNGADLAREIRRRVPRQKIVIVSGYSEADALDTLTDRDTLVLRKPFSAADLIAALSGLATAAA